MSPYGVCRKNPPVVDPVHGGGYSATWPIVPGDAWCGQFSPKRQAPWTATTEEER